jgi:iron complex outermembrane receptor protein
MKLMLFAGCAAFALAAGDAAAQDADGAVAVDEVVVIVLLTSQQDKTFSAWSGRVGLRYELTDDANVYATYNRGFKSGGFFGGLATTPEELIPYDNEKLDAFEVGLKSELFERRLRLNLSAFYYDYQDQQVFAQALRNA